MRDRAKGEGVGGDQIRQRRRKNRRWVRRMGRLQKEEDITEERGVKGTLKRRNGQGRAGYEYDRTKPEKIDVRTRGGETSHEGLRRSRRREKRHLKSGSGSKGENS